MQLKRVTFNSLTEGEQKQLVEKIPPVYRSNIPDDPYQAEYIKALKNQIKEFEANWPQGYWKFTIDSDHVGHHSCSECGCEPYYRKNIEEEYRFCPNCGARMKGADDV